MPRAGGVRLEQGDADEPEGLAQLLEQGLERPAAAQHAAGQGREGRRLGACGRGLAGAARGEVDHGAHGSGDDDEGEQGEHVLAVGDGEAVHGRGEPPVEQGEPQHGAGKRGQQAPDEGDGDDGHEEGKDVARQRQLAAEPEQDRSEQWQPGEGQREARGLATDGEAGGAAAPRPGGAVHLLVGDQVDVDRS